MEKVSTRKKFKKEKSIYPGSISTFTAGLLWHVTTLYSTRFSLIPSRPNTPRSPSSPLVVDNILPRTCACNNITNPVSIAAKSRRRCSSALLNKIVAWISSSPNSYKIRGTRVSNPGYEDINIRGTRVSISGVRGYQTRGTMVSNPGSNPGYDGIKSGVRRYQIRGIRSRVTGY